MVTAPSPRFDRYVAIGDSSTEGLDDPDENGGFRGWANRLAEHLAAHQGSVQYANLGVRGLRTRLVLESQLEAALAMRPDLATLFTGTNDVAQRRFDPAEVGRDVEQMQRALVAQGATVLTFTLPDLRPVMPLARFVTGRVLALNDALRRACAGSGAILVDVAQHPVASDPRLWSEDRLHANAVGHARIAMALAGAIGLPGIDDSWKEPLDTVHRPSLVSRLAAEARWTRKYLIPWVWRHLRGRSSSDGITAKRLVLQPMSAARAPEREALRG